MGGRLMHCALVEQTFLTKMDATAFVVKDVDVM